MDALVRVPDTTYTLARALLVYENGRDVLVTTHEVLRGGCGDPDAPAYLGPAQPFSPKSAGDLLRRITKAKTGCGYLPERVLSYDSSVILWTRPEGLCPLFFESTNETLNALSGRPLPHPRLLFLVRGQALYVWAVRQRGRPRPATILYRAPYFNVGSSGSVCPGTMTLPTAATPDTITQWEDAFFRSAFTHGSGTQFLTGRGYVDTLAELADDVDAGGRVSFPTARLVRAGRRLRDLL